MRVDVFHRSTFARQPLYATIRAVLALRYGMPLNGHRLTFAEMD